MVDQEAMAGMASLQVVVAGKVGKGQEAAMEVMRSSKWKMEWVAPSAALEGGPVSVVMVEMEPDLALGEMVATAETVVMVVMRSSHASGAVEPARKAASKASMDSMGMQGYRMPSTV